MILNGFCNKQNKDYSVEIKMIDTSDLENKVLRMVGWSVNMQCRLVVAAILNNALFFKISTNSSYWLSET